MLWAVFFLAPWTALATLAGAASVPIVIHLLNRRRYRVTPWAAMRFLLAAQKRTTRKLRIEQWLLLAIRTLIIVLLLLAMICIVGWMEPFWARLFPDGVSTRATRIGRTHRIIVLDGSFSMARRHADGTSFERAKRTAREIIESANAGDGFSLVMLAAPTQVVVPGPSDNTANVLREIDSIRLPHGGSDLVGGIAAIEKIVAQPLGKYQQREVYILTDLQRMFFQAAGAKILNAPTVREPSAAPESKSDADPWRRIQSSATVAIVDVAREGADNLAVTNLTLGEPLALVGSPNSITAVVHNYGGKNADSAKVQLRIGRARPELDDATKAPPFKLAAVEDIPIKVPAGGSLPVTFSHRFTSAGEYIVQVHVEGDDALDVDNSRSLLVAVKESIPIVLINGKPAADRDDQATHHLNVALRPGASNDRGTFDPLAASSPFRPRVLTEAQFADPVLGDLTNCDCIFVCDVARLSERKVEKLKNFLRRGGGVVFSLGGKVDPEAFNRLLYENGDGIVPARLLGRKRAAEDRYFSLHVENEAFDIPPLLAFSSDEDRATLLATRSREYYRVELAAKVSSKTLLSFLPSRSEERGARIPLDPAVLEWQRFRGKVILITTTLNIDWGSWPGSSAFLPLMHELVRHTALASPPRVVTVGDPLLEYLPSQLGGLEAVIATPDARQAPVTVDGKDDAAIVRFPETDQSGVYRLTIGSRSKEYLFAVNVPTSNAAGLGSESDLNRVAVEELETPGSDLQVVADLSEIKHTPRSDAAQSIDEAHPVSSAGPAVARWLLLAMLVLLILEMVLAWLFGSARTVDPGTATAPGRRGGSFAGLVISLLPWLPILTIVALLLHEAATGEFLGFLSSSLRDPMERWMGVSQATPGEGTRWKLEYLSYLTGDAGADRWLAFGLLLGVGVLAGVIYYLERVATRARAPGESPLGSVSLVPLAGIRLGLLFLTLVLLLPQLRLAFEREGWPDVVILIDTSKSFGATDDYQDSDVEARAKALHETWLKLSESKIAPTEQRLNQLQAERNGNPSPERIAEIAREIAATQELLIDLRSPSRLNLVKALIGGKDRDWVHRLIDRRQVKVHVYECSGKTTRLAEVIDATQAEIAVGKIRDLRAAGESSQLGGAVRAVLNDFRGGSLGAIIVLTDGITTEGEGLGQASRHAARADVPLYVVGVGDAHEPRDLVLHDLHAEDSVNVRDRLLFDVRVTAKGKLEKSAVEVVLQERKKDGSVVELKREPVQLEQGRPVKVRLATIPTEPGDHTYIVSVPEQADEKDMSNNRIEKRVNVADAKPVRVLYIEGYPRYEYRFVKSLLEREAASAQGNRSIQLKTLLVDADRGFARQDKTALPREELPSRDELFSSFDAIILGDVDPKSPKLGEKNLQMLRDFVREKGGGMLLLAGEQHMPHSYRDTPLADIMPILFPGPGETESPEERRVLDTSLTFGYKLKLTPIGQQHPIFRLVSEETDNIAIWGQLEPLYWAASAYRAKPTAEVLAVHPSIRARRGPGEGFGAEREVEMHPLAVQAFVGAGRSIFFGFDETWRWRYREFEIRFNEFWLQTVRYLSRNRVGKFDLRLDRQTPYRRNEPIRVTLRFPDDQARPADKTPINVLVERSRLRRPNERVSEPLDAQTLALTLVKGSRATYEALLTRTPEGEYKFTLTAPSQPGARPQTEGRVIPPPGELDRLRMDRGECEQAARDSRGQFYTLAEADSVPDDLPSSARVALNQPRQPWPLWNHPLMFLLMLGLLTSEWILRKRRRLL